MRRISSDSHIIGKTKYHWVCIQVIVLGEASKEERLLDSHTLRESFVIADRPAVCIQLLWLDSWGYIRPRTDKEKDDDTDQRPLQV
jgi:hypothetical protein